MWKVKIKKMHASACIVCISHAEPLINPHFIVLICHVFLLSITHTFLSSPLHFRLNASFCPVYSQATCQSPFLPDKYWFFWSSTLNSNHNTTPFPTDTNRIESTCSLFFTSNVFLILTNQKYLFPQNHQQFSFNWILIFQISTNFNTVILQAGLQYI